MKAGKDNNYAYNKNLKEFARENRNGMTKAEACLWKYVLRAGGVHGFTFRRQRSVLNYIADFMCRELMLIIEVDGITHTYEEVQKDDQIRQKALEDVGFRVIRFTDDEVLKGINRVSDEIHRVAKSIMIEKNITPSIRKQNQS